MSPSMRRLVSALALTLLPVSLHAQTIMSNLMATPLAQTLPFFEVFSRRIEPNVDVFTGIRMGSTAHTFDSFKARFYVFNSSATATVSGGIYAHDASGVGAPGALLGSFTAQPVAGNLGAIIVEQIATFTLAGGPLTLEANTAYWFGFTHTGGPSYEWTSAVREPGDAFPDTTPLDASGTGVTSLGTRVRLNGTGQLFTAPTAPHFALNGTATVSTVPEPGTYALLATGLAALGVLHRRRRNTRR